MLIKIQYSVGGEEKGVQIVVGIIYPLIETWFMYCGGGANAPSVLTALELNLELLQRHYPFDPQDLASCGNDVKNIFST